MVFGPKVSMRLKSCSETDDSIGGTTSVWINIKNIKGVLQNASGKEEFIIGKKTVIATHHFFCDYDKNTTITEKYKLSLGSRNFDIILVDNIDHIDKYLKIYLLEIK